MIKLPEKAFFLQYKTMELNYLVCDYNELYISDDFRELFGETKHFVHKFSLTLKQTKYAIAFVVFKCLSSGTYRSKILKADYTNIKSNNNDYFVNEYVTPDRFNMQLSKIPIDQSIPITSSYNFRQNNNKELNNFRYILVKDMISSEGESLAKYANGYGIIDNITVNMIPENEIVYRISVIQDSAANDEISSEYKYSQPKKALFLQLFDVSPPFPVKNVKTLDSSKKIVYRAEDNDVVTTDEWNSQHDKKNTSIYVVKPLRITEENLSDQCLEITTVPNCEITEDYMITFLTNGNISVSDVIKEVCENIIKSITYFVLDAEQREDIIIDQNPLFLSIDATTNTSYFLIYKCEDFLIEKNIFIDPMYIYKLYNQYFDSAIYKKLNNFQLESQKLETKINYYLVIKCETQQLANEFKEIMKIASKEIIALIKKIKDS